MSSEIERLRLNFQDKFHLITTSDGCKLFLRDWTSIKDAKTAIIALHGITAYHGPYETIAIPLASEGYAVYGLDLRGHGYSDGIRGDYPSRKRLVQDLCEAIAFVKNRHDKVILLGHSMGVASSIIAISGCLNKIDGLILASAGLERKPDAYPKISTMTKIKYLFSSLLRPNYPIIKYEREGMKGIKDPLFNFRYTVRFLRFIDVKNFIKSPKSLDIPVLVTIGDKDELFSIESCKKLYNLIFTHNKEFIVMKNGKHAEFPKGSWDQAITWLKRNFPV